VTTAGLAKKFGSLTMRRSKSVQMFAYLKDQSSAQAGMITVALHLNMPINQLMLKLPGVTIGECSVVSAGEVVRKSIPDYSMLVDGEIRPIDPPK
jgi:hypothetical protein